MTHVPLMMRTAHNAGNKFVARCGHLVRSDDDYVMTSDSAGLSWVHATVLRWCSPACADRYAESRARGETVKLPTCAWKGCDLDGSPRNIEMVWTTTDVDAAVLVTFSEDVPLCDLHEQDLRAKVMDVLTTHEEAARGQADAG